MANAQAVNTLPSVINTLPHVINTLPHVLNTLPRVINTLVPADNTLAPVIKVRGGDQAAGPDAGIEPCFEARLDSSEVEDHQDQWKDNSFTAVPRRARIEGSWTFASLNSRLVVPLAAANADVGLLLSRHLVPNLPDTANLT